MLQDLPPCPQCSDRNLAEVADYVDPDENDREPAKYWWCLSCDWKSQTFYYPDSQPELSMWEPVSATIEVSRQDYDFLLELMQGLAEDLPFNLRVRQALRKLESMRVVEVEQS